MQNDEKNPAKLIFLVALILILVLLIAAIDNKIVRLIFVLVLFVSIAILVMSFVADRRKKINVGFHKVKELKHDVEEGFVIKKPEQSLAQKAPESLNPREEFKKLLKEILLLIKNNIVADSVAFYWSNEDKGQMVFEEGVTVHKFNFVKRYNWNDDALTMSAKTGTPKVIGDINLSAGEDIIKYQNPRVGVKSLLVYPVSYRDKIVGVVLLDSAHAQAFSQADVENVKMFCELISDLIENYIAKFELYYKARILEIISDVETLNTDVLLAKVRDFAIKVLDCVAVAVVLYENGRWIVSMSYSRVGKYVEAGTEINLAGSLVGEVITNGVPKIVSSTRSQDKVIRFTEGEKINIESSIAVVPIIYGRKCYGAILFEHSKPGFFSSYNDVKKLQDLATVLGILLENISLNELVENYFGYDEETSLMKKSYFYNQLNIEIERKSRHDGELTLALISVDNVDYIKDTYGDDAVKFAQLYVSKIIKSNVNSYDLVESLEENLIAVALVETGPNDAYIWAEKLRKLISNQEIKFKDRSFGVTITAGISAWDNDKSAEEFVDRAKKSFLKIRQNVENVVRVF